MATSVETTQAQLDAALADLYGYGTGGGGGGGYDMSGLDVTSLISGAISGILSGVFEGLSGLLGGAANEIKKLLDSGFGQFLETLLAIIDEIKKIEDVISGIENDIIKPIKSVVDGLTSVVDGFRDKIIDPISNLINGTKDMYTALIKGIGADIQQGLKGFLKIPGDFANALDDLDARLGRAMQELGDNNSSIVKDILVPGIQAGIGTPITEQLDKLNKGPFSEDLNAVDESVVKLNETSDLAGDVENLKVFEYAMAHESSWWGGIINWLWRMLKEVDLYAAMIENTVTKIRQEANLANPANILDAGDAIEAVRRGYITPDAWAEEMGKGGWDQTRQAVLYDLATYLFGPQDAVKLLARGIINSDEFAKIMADNNLIEDQPNAVQQLMAFILSPGDVAAAYARGLVSSGVMYEMMQYNLVPESLQATIRDLELTLVPPAKTTAFLGRFEAATEGFLAQSLTSEPPKDLKEQYDRTQAETGTAELDWLAHWNVPGAEWWTQAYYRGLRTWTELQAAFKALNYPPEVWPDILGVAEELPPVWLVPDVVGSGVWGEDQAVPTLQKLGFSEENARILYQYGTTKQKATKAFTATDLQGLTLANAKAAYADGLISADEYTNLLSEAGYGKEAASLTVSLETYKLVLAQRKAQADLIINEVKLGDIDASEGQSQLYALGMTDAEVSTYLAKLEATKAADRRLPSEAQIEKMFKDGLITPEETAATMQLLGYSAKWAGLIIQTW